MLFQSDSEHGRRDRETNVTDDDELTTGKIAWAHLNEFPDYYTRLEKMEAEAERYWADREGESASECSQRVEDHGEVDRLLEERAGDGRQVADCRDAHGGEAQAHSGEDALAGDE